jgi:hypothetical protein
MRGRVRWGNVGRAAGAVAVVALVVAWPRLGGEPIVVPGGAAVPVATPGAAPSPRPARTPRPVRTPTGTAQVRKEPARRRRDRRPPPRDEAPPAGAPPTPPPAQPVTRAPPPTPTIDPAEREFGFER